MIFWLEGPWRVLGQKATARRLLSVLPKRHLSSANLYENSRLLVKQANYSLKYNSILNSPRHIAFKAAPISSSCYRLYSTAQIPSEKNGLGATSQNGNGAYAQKNEETPTSHSPEEPKADFKDIGRLLLLAKRDWKLLLVAILLLTISCTIGMSIPKVIGMVLDALKNTLNNESLKDENGNFQIDALPPIAFGLTLPEFMGAFALALLFGTIANFGRIVMLRILSERVVARLRSNVIKKTLHQDAEFFDNHKVGDLLSRLGSDAYVVSRSMTQKVSDGFKALLCGGVGIGMMVAISPELSAYLLLFTPPVLLSASIFGKRIRQNSRSLQEATGELTRVSEEQLNGVKTVQSFVAEGKELKRYDTAIRGIFNVGKQSAFINAKFFSLTSVLGDMSFLVVLFYGSYLVLQGGLSIGDLTAYMMYTEYTGGAIFSLSTFYSELMQGAGAASRLFELTDRVPAIKPTVGKKFIPGKGEVEFRNVSFAYPTRPGNLIFKNLNFKIKQGSNVCIVGPSGRGKSTIASLLLRYYNPTSGKILVDGQDICTLNSKSLRRHMGIVQQEPVLMSGTIRDNITYGLTYEPSKDTIRSVAKQCFCHNFITKFPNAYDTIIGPHGTLLSGGQKQRIAIARALIKQPGILLLDEATSALDVESEGAINYTFGQLMKSGNVTIISIAHRLSTIRRSENIIVLGSDGSVVEMGKFKELFADPSSELSKLLNEKSSRADRQSTPPPPTPSPSSSSENPGAFGRMQSEEDILRESPERTAPSPSDAVEDALNEAAEKPPINISP